MCGIVGYIGDEAATPFLLDGLAKLEYRGYDSAGISTMDETGIETHKAKGYLANLRERIRDGEGMTQTVGIGHTRWATHGKPCDENSHPHCSENGLFSVVHNGIIENFAVLKEQLIASGVTFASETDTEVVAQLLAKEYTGDFFAAVKATVAQLEGSYALGILCADYPHEIMVVRNASPLIIGLGEGENYIASDIPAVLSHTRKILQLKDHEMARLTKDSVTVYAADGTPIDKEPVEITWDAKSAEKGGYEHFMIKEIMEQPTALRATLSPRIKDGEIVLDGITLTQEQLKDINRVCIIACGSAYHVGLVAKYVFEKLVRVPVDVDVASEFRYRDPLVDEHTLAVVISQSGETADTLAGLREAKKRGARVLSVVNVVGSTIANESDDVLYTWAGPEISVATTKAYSAQLAMMYLIAFYVAHKLERITDGELAELLKELQHLPDEVEKILKQAPAIQELAKKYIETEHAYFIGRNLDYAVSMEASLKLKEISYIHSEAYAAGELKHGTISLVEEGTFVVALACCESLIDKTVSNIKEVRARGADVLLLTTEERRESVQDVGTVLCVPRVHDLLMPSLEVVPLQMLGYYIALARGCSIDKPRNLAKSVTVE